MRWGKGMQDIYKYEDYKTFLTETARNMNVRGYKAALAEAAGCQRSFLSQALNGPVHLTIEHAVGISKFLNLDVNQSLYLETMVGWARAGSAAIKAIYFDRMKKLRAESKNLAKRFDAKSLQTDNLAMSEYYSDALYSLVHLLLTIPQFRTAESIAHKLRRPTSLILDVLRKLQTWGLVESAKQQWQTTQKQVHIPQEHPMVHVHHRNFRDAAAENALGHVDQNLRYSAIYTMSEKDVETLKHMTVEFVEKSRKLVTNSKEQSAVIFNIDLIRI